MNKQAVPFEEKDTLYLYSIEPVVGVLKRPTDRVRGRAGPGHRREHAAIRRSSVVHIHTISGRWASNSSDEGNDRHGPNAPSARLSREPVGQLTCERVF